MRHSLAVFTLTRNDGEQLRRWLSYYRRHVSPEHIFVLDRQSTDVNTVAAANTVNRIPVADVAGTDLFGYVSCLHTFRAFLLQSYQYVLFAMPFEFLLAREGLKRAVQKSDASLLDGARCRSGMLYLRNVVATGYTLLRLRGEPGRFDNDGALLRTRTLWQRNELLDCHPFNDLRPGRVTHESSSDFVMLRVDADSEIDPDVFDDPDNADSWVTSPESRIIPEHWKDQL